MAEHADGGPVTLLGHSMGGLPLDLGSVASYLDFWRAHPALADDWSPYVERYLETDLVEIDGALRPSTRKEAVIADTESDLREGVVESSLKELRQPVVHLRAPRGLLDQEPPLYPEPSLEPWRAVLPQLETELVDDCNQYTILLADAPARRVAERVRRLAAD